MATFTMWVRTLGIFLINIHVAFSQLPLRKFEYKYSFKGPYLAQKDGSVPYWTYSGNAIASGESFRITPSLKSQKGSAWTKSMTNFPWWEVEVVFRVTGRGRIGADGLAFWYTSNQGAEGPVFGTSDNWNGLGIFFDSFDNDNKNNNPHIYAIVNDGTKSFDHQNDGGAQQLAGCLRDFRNKPYPVRAKIEYYKNSLTVSFHNGLTNDPNDHEMCFRADNVMLPQSGYFGLSAATGGLAVTRTLYTPDDHDVLQFMCTSLSVPDAGYVPDSRISEDERTRLTREYEDLQKKMTQQREDYRREHPDANAIDDDDEDEEFEMAAQRELRQIFEGQSRIMRMLADLHRKSDEVIGRQERTLSMLSSQASGGMPQQPGAGIGGPQLPIQRHEVDMVLNTQKEVVAISRELRSMVGVVKDNLHTGSGPSQGFDFQNHRNDIRDMINNLRHEIMQKLNTAPPNAGGTVCTGCLTTTTFVAVLIVQLVVLLGYNIYRDRKENMAKKFY